jgi:hypothetical protein
MRCSRLLPKLLLATFFVLAPAAGTGQEPEPDAAQAPLRVFLDCQAYCDPTYVHTEIDWVDWVRDQEDATVHVLVTSEGTGGGGRSYALAFLGRGSLADEDRSFSFATSGDATADETRAELVRVLAVGLAGFARGTPAFARLRVTHTASEGAGAEGAAASASGSADDPWNFWVFNLNLSASVSGESQQSSSSLSTSASANRTTDAWKFNLSGFHNRRVEEFELTETTDRFVRESWDVDGLLVKSLGDHWSVGGRAAMGSSTFLNHDFRWSVRPGIEYNVFPYAQTARQSLTTQYLIGLHHWDYEEETLFGETEETRASHSITTRLDLTQPWGQSELSVTGSQYFHDLSKYSVSVFGSLDVRLFRGFSFRVFGRYQWIRDQLGILKGEIDDDEILTRQRELETSFRYGTSFGISYRFGSIFNNVVNSRFGGSGGSVFFF